MTMTILAAAILITFLVATIWEAFDGHNTKHPVLAASILVLALLAATYVGAAIAVKRINISAESEPERGCYKEFGVFRGGDFIIRMTPEEFEQYCEESEE